MSRSQNAVFVIAGVATLAMAGRLAWKANEPAPRVASSASHASVPVAVLPPVAPAAASASFASLPPPEVAALVTESTPSAASKKTAKPRRPTQPSPVAAPMTSPIVPLDVARSALDAVGADPDAEAVWTAAINDPSLSPHDRSDLIEDLNENGFGDPDHVTPDELPLVLARLDLIEQLAPDAMDDVNAAAFAEAYKDLSNIADRLTR